MISRDSSKHALTTNILKYMKNELHRDRVSITFSAIVPSVYVAHILFIIFGLKIGD